MPLVHAVIALALIEYFVFGFAVARARGRYGVHAPATTGNEVFERYYRVQMNTLEQLVVFVPSMVLFAHYVQPLAAAALGLVFIAGRALYFRAYVRAPASREMGFGISAFANITLLVGALIGAVRAALGA